MIYSTPGTPTAEFSHRMSSASLSSLASDVFGNHALDEFMMSSLTSHTGVAGDLDLDLGFSLEDDAFSQLLDMGTVQPGRNASPCTPAVSHCKEENINSYTTEDIFDKLQAIMENAPGPDALGGQ